MLRALGHLLHRFVLRTQRSPLRPIWSAAHRGVIRAVAVWVRRDVPETKVYLKGGFGFAEPVYGLSDVDMIVVAPDDRVRPGANRERVERRWERLCRVLPPLREIFQLWVYEDADLRDLEEDTYLTFGLDDASNGRATRSAFFGARSPSDSMALLDHPGLYGPRRDWRPLGSAKHPPKPVVDPARRAIFAWLELRFLWGYAFLTSVHPGAASAAHTCQKLVADAARVWLWLHFGEQAFDRDEVLARALRRMPEEEPALRRAAELGRRLPRRPEPPLDEVLPFLARMSSRIAGHLADATTSAPTTKVRLAWGGEAELVLAGDPRSHVREPRTRFPESPLLPLADWRACAIPGLLDQAFSILPGQPTDPVRLADLARTDEPGLFPALRGDGLLVLPTTAIWHRGRLRGVECPTSDPVSFALADGASCASFPAVLGWSAPERARRALAEHSAWLERVGESPSGPIPGWVDTPPGPALTGIVGLFSAARAALFAESLAAGEPELPLTVATIAERLAQRGRASGAAADAALAALRASDADQPEVDGRTVAELRDVVRALPAYKGGSRSRAAVTRPQTPLTPTG